MPKASEPLKVQIVGPVSTNIDDPWRTQGDYKEDQNLMRISHEQMLKANRWTIALAMFTIITTVVTAAATVIMALAMTLK